MSNHPNPSPGDVIALRIRHGLTQGQAAKAWLVSLRTVQNWEAPVDSPNHRRVHPTMWWAMRRILEDR